MLQSERVFKVQLERYDLYTEAHGIVLDEFNYFISVGKDTDGNGNEIPCVLDSNDSVLILYFDNIGLNEYLRDTVHVLVSDYVIEYQVYKYEWTDSMYGVAYYIESAVYNASESEQLKLVKSIIYDVDGLPDETIEKIISESIKVV